VEIGWDLDKKNTTANANSGELVRQSARNKQQSNVGFGVLTTKRTKERREFSSFGESHVTIRAHAHCQQAQHLLYITNLSYNQILIAYRYIKSTLTSDK
jgi:hypothetical protein